MSSNTGQAAAPSAPGELPRKLGLRDAYAVSTGAMLSSGLFLLPGLASTEAGPAVVFAYLLAGIMVIPAMLSAAELASAMPRSGGIYHFADHSLGPLAATIAGLGKWVTLVFKSSFAFVGVGAYLAIFIDVPIQPVAIGLALAFLVVNAIGARQTSRVEVALVAVLLLILGYFIVAGVFDIGRTGTGDIARAQFSPFMPQGLSGVLSATGLVFISYAGLTQVAAIGGEIQEPGRNIPRSMILSLATAVTIYVAGTSIMVGCSRPAP